MQEVKYLMPKMIKDNLIMLQFLSGLVISIKSRSLLENKFMINFADQK